MPDCGCYCCHIKIPSFSFVFHAQSDSRVVTRQNSTSQLFQPLLSFSDVISNIFSFFLRSLQTCVPFVISGFLVLYYYSTFLWHLDLRGMCGHKTKYITEACHIITQHYPVLLNPQISYLIFFFWFKCMIEVHIICIHWDFLRWTK